MGRIKPESVPGLAHKASSALSVAAAILLQISQVVPATSWLGLAINVAGAVGLGGLLGNVLGKKKE